VPVWTEKYRPRRVEEVVGNERAKREFLEWVERWRAGKAQEAGILLVGPPGIGKTSWVHAFANSYGYTLIETNASDYRSESALKERLGHLTRATTLDAFFRGEGARGEPLIFLDEVDGLDPRQDRGGLQAVVDIARESGVLTVLAANVVDPREHKVLLDNFHVVEFHPLTPRQIELILRRIVEEEGLDIPDEKLREIAAKANGDARTAINMLQSLAVGMEISAMETAMENLPFDTFVKRLFEAASYEEVVSLIQSNVGHLEDLIHVLWDITIRSGMSIDFVKDFLNRLSDIDIIWRRINLERNWGLMRYLFTLIPNYVVRLKRYVTYEERIPEYRYYLFIKNRKVREQREEVLNLLPRLYHVSKRKFITEVLPYNYERILHDGWKDFREWCARMYGAAPAKRRRR